MNGWNPEIPQENLVDEPPRHQETVINVGNAALSGVMFVALSASVYGGVKAGAIDAAIGAFRTSSEVTETTTEVSQAPKVVKPVAKDVGETAGEQGQKIEGAAAEAGRGAVGAETEKEKDRNIISKNIEQMFEGNYPAGQFLTAFIAIGGYEDDFTKPKSMNIVKDPQIYNSRMQLMIELFDKEVQERKIQPNQVAGELAKVGQPKQASQLWGDIYLSSITGKPLSNDKLAEIKGFFESEEGIPWTD